MVGTEKTDHAITRHGIRGLWRLVVAEDRLAYLRNSERRQPSLSVPELDGAARFTGSQRRDELAIDESVAEDVSLPARAVCPRRRAVHEQPVAIFATGKEHSSR